MKKHTTTFITIILTVIVTSALFFGEYTLSDVEKTIFIVVISLAVGYLSNLKTTTETMMKRLMKAEKLSKVGFWYLELANHKLYWSQEIFDIFEIDSTKFKPSYELFLHIIHPDDRERVSNAYTKSLKNKEAYEIEHRLLMNDGSIRWVKEECETEFDKNGNPLVSIGIVTDVTKEIEYLNKIELQLNTDYLTQLNNRKSYNERIGELLSLKKRNQTPFSMVMYDIDDFKNVNDTYGHDVGDTVLIKMSQLVKSHLRESDYLFRIGGEEFIILLTETHLENAKKVSSKICKSVEENLKSITNHTITISIGVSEANESDSEDTIFKRVDKLLYKSKHSGKNKVSY